MNLKVAVWCTIAFALALMPMKVGAQEPSTSFNDLQGVLKVGQKLVITDKAGNGRG